MKNKLLIFTIIFSSFFTLIQAEKKTLSELPQRYKTWLNEEVVYIISSIEKDVFLQLKTDRERELFIGAFWKNRDKILGTPENEFKEEHYRRIDYANYNFGRTVAKPGWKTDRGRFYIILGKPRDIESYIGLPDVFNNEVWYCEGLSKYGLPHTFSLLFFQKQGIGEYILHSPVSDGPQALMPTYWERTTGYLEAFRTLSRIQPVLARASITRIPGERSGLSYGSASLASEQLLQNIYTAPQKELKDTYAEKFLRYKDIIEVEYSTNYIDNDASVKVLKDSSGIYFVHYVVELTKFSVESYEGKYSTYLKVNGNVSDLEGKTIYQYERSLSIKIDETQLKNIAYSPFNLYDMFPLLPGEYKLSVIIKNEASREFTSLEKNISIPGDDSFLQMSPLILSYKIDQVPSESKTLKPFKIGNNQIYCQPSKVFHPNEKLFLVFQILGLTSSLEQNGHIKFEFLKGNEPFSTLTRKVSEYKDRIIIKEEFPLQKFPPGFYRIQVSLFEGNQELLYEGENFEITPISTLPRPWVFSRTLLPPEDPVYSSALGKQFFSKGEIYKARTYFEDAYHKKPNSLDFALSLAKVYFVLKEYDKIKQILSVFSESPESRFEIYSFLGQSHQALGEFDKAVVIYNKAISHFGINSNLLNSVGECYYRLGSHDEAVAAWKKSLEINPDQPKIKKNIEESKK